MLRIQLIGKSRLIKAAGLAIGIVGDAGVRANAQQDKIFVGMILILIFGEALALYGLIVSLILTSQWSHNIHKIFFLHCYHKQYWIKAKKSLIKLNVDCSFWSISSKFWTFALIFTKLCSTFLLGCHHDSLISWACNWWLWSRWRKTCESDFCLLFQDQ